MRPSLCPPRIVAQHLDCVGRAASADVIGVQRYVVNELAISDLQPCDIFSISTKPPVTSTSPYHSHPPIIAYNGVSVRIARAILEQDDAQQHRRNKPDRRHVQIEPAAKLLIVRILADLDDSCAVF